jgi:hypothetical protein
MDRPRIEIFTSAGKCLHVDSLVKVRIGSEVATLTAGEWARLIANPQRADILATEAR